MEAQDEEADDDEDPVDVVGDDGTVGGRIGPAKDTVQDTPRLRARRFRAAALQKSVCEIRIGKGVCLR